MKRRAKILGGILVALVVVVAAGVATLALWVSHDSPCGAAPPMPSGEPAMEAVAHRCYGSPDVAKLETIPKPAALGPHAVLIRVHASSVNPIDWHYLEGTPYIVRAMLGVGAPHDVRLGTDFAGKVRPVIDRRYPLDEIAAALRYGETEHARGKVVVDVD